MNDHVHVKPTRWSYSSLSTWESCPLKWWFGYMEKREEPPSPAMARGTRLHATCEEFLDGQIGVIPWGLTKVARRLQDLLNLKAKAENVWLLDQEWLPNEESPWIKAIVDVHYVVGDILHVIDFKSGQMYPDHKKQLELYALIGLQMYPEVKKAEYSALYLDSGREANDGSVLRELAEPKRVDWHTRATTMMDDNDYQPKPGPACKWCAFSQRRNGPCRAG